VEDRQVHVYFRNADGSHHAVDVQYIGIIAAQFDPAAEDERTVAERGSGRVSSVILSRRRRIFLVE
jgi:hypothetical protein